MDVAIQPTTFIVTITGLIALLFAWYCYRQTAKIQLSVEPTEEASLLQSHGSSTNGNVDLTSAQMAEVRKIGTLISNGAQTFLRKEYQYLSVFIIVFGAVILVLIGVTHTWVQGLLSTFSFIVGALTSIVAGYIGMRIAVFANSRTAVKAVEGFNPAFQTAFQSGAVMGFALVGLGLLSLYMVINVTLKHYPTAFQDPEATKLMYECIAGYGLGGSSIALFSRVGGGIFTKAADVGADMCKIEYGMDEDSAENPAVIADNVGDNVGDIAGMGADLFGSFAESACAAMLIAAQSNDLFNNWQAVHFPLVVAGVGIMVSLLTSLVASKLQTVHKEEEIEAVLVHQLAISTSVMTPAIVILCYYFLPHAFSIGAIGSITHYKPAVLWWHVAICLELGLWCGLLVGNMTNYYTSYQYEPTRLLSNACKSGNASFNIILGLALGYKSCVVPVFAMAVTIYISFTIAGLYGISMNAIGILCTLCTGLTIDAYGPICDNAGGIAEMSGLGKETRERTDALDAAGNTTAAIGKGFAIGSAAFVSLALFGAFVTTIGLNHVDILTPATFAGLLIGGMLPYWFSFMTMAAVGHAAHAMSEEVAHQLHRARLPSEDAEREIYYQKLAARKKEQEEKMVDAEDEGRPDYEACIAISTEASLREMVAPGVLVIGTPIIVGFLFGVECLAGVLTGTLISGVQIATSAANSGGAWDNAKKYIENVLHRKGTKQHAAAVVGDTVGDPLKDTSGPSLNILVKLMAILSLVFAPAFPGVGTGGLLGMLCTRVFGHTA
eukprot:gb/GEZN01001481.1/.p1 GENE.gb/GEZN01001481.1/~~gb/GEZN01001481.1/.p1  ORF type:complete len:779 (-),score=122.45 gb/GEZN01001481.1/:609-2945(-)